MKVNNGIFRFFIYMLLFAASTACMDMGCMQQYNPHPYWAQMTHERQLAHRKTPNLTEDGHIPKPEAEVVADPNASPIDTKFLTFCSSCHGADGTAKTAAGAALNPHPRNFTDTAWQGKVDDAHIHKVIKEGGASVGLSGMMAPWGAVMDDATIDEMVKKIRKFGGK